MSRAIRVLVVDDHQMLLESLVRILERQEGVQIVAAAGTAAEGVALAAQHKPDVVVMDYQLPDADGASAATEIRAEHPDTKVIMLTGFVDDSVLLAAIEAGCCGFVTKDRAVMELVAAVRAAADGEALIPPALLARLLPKLGHSNRGLGNDLTRREHEVLTLMAEGLSNKAIAQRMAISVNTVRNHVQNLMMKLQAHSRLEAVASAAREGLIKYR
jgi:DNA-binding NarL/FixJ family response regulator